MRPLVSILIPAYNAGHWLAETLRSALAQTWPHREIIVVDDGSRDSTLQVARAFESSAVRVFTQTNQGAAAARNRALSLATGDLIQWLDADDLLSPGKIAAQVDLYARCNDPRVLCSCGWAYFFHRPARARFQPTPLWEDLAPLEWMRRKWEGNWHMQTATWLVPRALCREAGPWNTRLLGDDDGEYFSRLIPRCSGIKFAPEARVYYRITGTNRLSYIGASDRKLAAQFEGMKLQISYLLALSADQRTKAACVQYLQTWLPHFYPNRPELVSEAVALASSLGGALQMPALPWKYAWLRPLIGYTRVKRVQQSYNACKTRLAQHWDRGLSLLDRSSGNR